MHYPKRETHESNVVLIIYARRRKKSGLRKLYEPSGNEYCTTDFHEYISKLKVKKSVLLYCKPIEIHFSQRFRFQYGSMTAYNRNYHEYKKKYIFSKF